MGQLPSSHRDGDTLKSPDVSVKVEHWQVLFVLKLHVGNIAYVAFAADSQETDQLLVDKEMNVYNNRGTLT